MLAGEGADVLSGGAGADLLSGEGGNDQITVGVGDTALGGGGDDTFLVAGDYTVAGSIVGGDGIDTIRLTSLTASFGAAVSITEVEVLALPSFCDVTMTGAQFDGLDSVRGGAVPTTAGILLTSTANNALVASGLTRLIVSAGNGNDRLDFGASGAGTPLTLNGGIGADSLTGGAAADSLDGGTQNDSLVGGDGADTLAGGLGNDTLVGGADADQLSATRGTTCWKRARATAPMAAATTMSSMSTAP